MPSFRVNSEWAKMSELLPNLYISGVTALKPADLKALNIRLIVNATSEVPNLNLWDVERIKLWVDDTDGEDLAEHFDAVCARIHMCLQEQQRVLVHCVAGVCRSATICLAYLTKYQCKSLREAYWLMADRRPMVRPNLSFWRQLISYEQILKGQAPSVRLVQTNTDDGGVAWIPDVYMPIVVPRRDQEGSPTKEQENPGQATPLYLMEGRQRQGSGQKPKYIPRLEPLPEDPDYLMGKVC